ncbi:MAG: DNA polymerase ligase N-terminal domain-containing protein [Nitrososphaerales archaeon]
MRFVIHKHQARHLHWDFRLEMDGVLKSWAVPKEPPSIPNVKRLAIEVEDHPIDYINFEGVIPEGEYGAGIVEIWDNGEYELIERNENMIKFNLKGKRLSGSYRLIRMKGNQWLLFKVAF